MVSQIEAVIAGIEERIGHIPTCLALNGCDDRNCKYDARVRSEIARTVERMVDAAASDCLSTRGRVPRPATWWAAAFRATQEQETQK